MTYTHTLSQRCEFCEREIGKTSNSKRKYKMNICCKCLANAPPNEYRCAAEVGRGTPMAPFRRCKRWSEEGKTMCPMHTKKKAKAYQEKEEVK